ncbi:MAG: 4Fe-4S dicluster domain-containing protein [Nitrospira sp.]|nr:4Fe-4S dicluster domain-containing protein [Nitrospira sp.]
MDRRNFLKILGSGVAGAATGNLLTPGRTLAKETPSAKEFYGILVDTTRCIGCRRCELGCAEVNGLPVPDISESKNENLLKTIRKTSDTQYTIINRYETEKGKIFVPKRCMHCNQPGCVAACLVKAMRKRPSGQVTWDLNCIGCRLCMISCPFDIPKFEYNKAIPRIQKCNLCYDRYNNGVLPACVEVCPTQALMFGSRKQILEEGKRRIAANPDKYIEHIYGEYEVGGTSHLYLSSVPFEQIGFRKDLGTVAYPKYSTGFLYAVPFIFVLWPIVMLGINRATKKSKEDEEHHEEKEKH